MPTLARGSGSSLTISNSGVAASAARYVANGTNQTASASAISPASNTTAGAIAFWSGVS